MLDSGCGRDYAADAARLRDAFLGKPVHVEVDRPIGYRHGDLVYPINYGFIPGVIAGDAEEQDAYILGVNVPVKSFDGRVVGIICRKNDCEDKLVVAPEGMVFHQGEIAEAVHFQERFFDSTVIPLFHKSCGVIPYRQTEGQREYLILHQGNGCWSFPKGHMEAGESETETALRELFEETGLTAGLIPGARTELTYEILPQGRKQVVLFLGEVHGTVLLQEKEIRAMRWVKAHALPDYLHGDTVNSCKKLLLIEARSDSR